MKIGVIGTGAIGGTLARHLAKLGHVVSAANSRGPESLASFALETGVHAASIAEVVKNARVVIVSVPEAAILKLPKHLFAAADADTIVVDTGNYYPQARDGAIPGLDTGLLDSQWVAVQVGRPVIKAFNNIGAASLRDKGRPAGSIDRVALPVSGDKAESRAVVMQLVEQLGFDAIDAGVLTASWRQQPGTPSYCHDLDARALQQALGAAQRDQLPRYRTEADTQAKRIMAERAKLRV